MFALLLALAAAPPPQPAEISAPFGHIGNVVTPVPVGGIPGSDKVLVPTWPSCEPQAIWMMRFFSGTARALEQLQSSLDRAPGAEKKLYGRTGVLSELISSLGTASFDARRDCSEPKLVDGFKLAITSPPKKWCDAPANAQDGAFWFSSQKKPVAVVQISPGGEKACRPRLSAVLFDSRGVARMRFHADWGGEASATLVGERCQNIEYRFDRDRQVFVPAWKSCKG